MFLGRRGLGSLLSALAAFRATEPQYVCGAATRLRHLHQEMKSGHDTGCRLRQNDKAEKNSNNPLPGVVCLLTNGDLISVRPSMGDLSWLG
jgi:hypothetical protein